MSRINGCHEFKYGVCCACATTEQTTSNDQVTLVISLQLLIRYLRMLPSNYSGMLIGLPISIMYFLARKITAGGAEERRAFNHLFSIRVPLCTLWLNSLFGYSMSYVSGSSCIVKSHDSGSCTSGYVVDTIFPNRPPANRHNHDRNIPLHR
ncbi:MAG: hypothetical protein C5S48_01140 [Candidatus Methanogaster sp.]|nr:MAG: hypothetical protein C5S48_01140 [ANME-2 cluster archaeon]